MLNIIDTSRYGHILIFDSGLGGTTILQALQQSLPNCTYSYALDNGAFPYGSQSDDFLMQRSSKLFQQLLQHDKPDAVVIACNTASTLFLDSLRQQFPDTPFIGVVPAIKPAAQITRSKTIALLATPATVNRQYIADLHRQFAQDCRLIRSSHPDLAILAENKIRYGDDVQQAVTQIVKELKQQDGISSVDTIILGCTHYPAIIQELSSAWGGGITWLDSSEAIAKRTQHVLALANLKAKYGDMLYLTAKYGDMLYLTAKYGDMLYLTATIDQQAIINSLSAYLYQPSTRLISI